MCIFYLSHWLKASPSTTCTNYNTYCFLYMYTVVNNTTQKRFRTYYTNVYIYDIAV